jgi:hypothetical protein
VVLIPAALVGAFLVFYQRTANTSHQISDVLAFGRGSWTMVTAAVSGLSGVLQAPVYDSSLAKIASAGLLALIVVGVAAMEAAAADVLGRCSRPHHAGGGHAIVPGRVHSGA